MSNTEEGVNTRAGMDIAVIGMGGRFPGARTIDVFWENLKKGMESVSFLSLEELNQLKIKSSTLENPNYVKAAGGILENKEYFDASFFGYSPTEAELMDPQLRIFHECCWEALENAAYDPGSYQGLIGLYAGAAAHLNWEILALVSGKTSGIGSFAASLLTDKDLLCTAVSYKLDLRGPSLLVQTACSTSLAAIHLACQAIINGECDMALAGGVNILSDKPAGYLYQEGMIASPDGHCRAFDARAKGLIGGEGAGVVVLKLLENALADGDHIYVVVKGSAMNNDGIAKSGYTAPSRSAQTEVIITAQQVAEVEPESIAYIEAHGTATSLGDPIEIDALNQAFTVPSKNYCAIGAVKSNIGHLGAAAGVTGFIKAVLTLVHKLIPPTINFEIPNPQIDFINSPLYVNLRVSKLEKGDYPLRVAVSSFGIGGTNVHVILEEAPLTGSQTTDHRPQMTDGRQYQLILLSALTPTALERMKENLAVYLQENPDINAADMAFSLQVGRKVCKHRWIAVCSSVDEAIEALTLPGPGETHTVSPQEEGTFAREVEFTADKHSLWEIGQLWLHGEKIDWNAFYHGEKRCRIPLPPYAFEAQRFWLDGDILSLGAAVVKEDRASGPDINDNTANWFYLPTWKRLPLNIQKNKAQPVKGCWLVFVNELSICSRLVKKLKEKGQQVLMVKSGDNFHHKENFVYTINPREISHYDTLFNQLQAEGQVPGKIIHLWNLTGGTGPDGVLNPGYFDIAQYTCFLSLLYTVKAIAAQGIDRDLQVMFLTDHVLDVHGTEIICPEKAPAQGLLKVIPQEYPNISCRHIDILLPGSDSPVEGVLIDQLMEEFTHINGEAVVAYRDNRRWVQGFEPLHLEEVDEKQVGLRENGVYLVTGGHGRLGLVLASLLARKKGTKLILTGRSDLPPGKEWKEWLNQHDEDESLAVKIKKLQELQEMGAEVIYLNANVAKKEHMQRVVAHVEKKYGSINGVIHAAGIPADISFRPLQALSREDCRELFQAKVYGLMVLEEVFSGKNLDFFWVISSLASILGGLNLGAFSAANSFVDAFVKGHNRSTSSRSSWLSLNWEKMKPEVSAAAFERLFSLEKVDQIVVSVGGNLPQRIEHWIKFAGVRNRDISEIKKKLTGYPRPDLSTDYVPPQSTLEEKIAIIWQEMFGFDKIGTRDDFFELGGDSLKIIMLVSRIQEDLNVRVPIPEFFDRPTIKELSQYIRAIPSDTKSVLLVPIEKREYYQLSSAQKRMFVIHQVNKNSLSYNIPYIFQLKLEIDHEKMLQGFKRLIKRHETLRSSFIMLPDGPVQVVHDDVPFSIEYYKESGEESILEIAANFIRPFDLGKAPAMRVGLIKTVQAKYMLMLDTYHIISDAFSFGVLEKDFIALYANRDLPLLEIQYKDFSEWQKRLYKTGVMDKQKEFWLGNLEGGDIPVLNIPLDFPRPPVRDIDKGHHLIFELDDALRERIYVVLNQTDTTLPMILFAVYFVLLFVYTKQEDIVVGMLSSGRSHACLGNLIGMFVNTLPVRSYPRKNKAFADFLKEIKRVMLDAYENQDYPFDELVVDLDLQGSSGRNPLFDVVFTYNTFDNRRTKARKTGSDIPDRQMEPHEPPVEFAKFDLYLQVTEVNDTLNIMLRYSTQLFKPSTIEKIKRYYIEILEQVMDNITVKLKDIILSHDLITVTSTVQRREEIDFNL